VAPKRRAVSSFSGTVSTATMTEAPESRQPWIAEMPTPPQPITTAVSPGRSWAVLTTEPTPVITPQPTRAATSYGTSGSIGTAPIRGTTISSANAPHPAIPNTGRSPAMNRGIAYPVITWVMHR
jgi:hypothetical protein